MEGDENIWFIKNFAKLAKNQGRHEKVADGLCVGAAKLGQKWKVRFCLVLFFSKLVEEYF